MFGRKVMTSRLGSVEKNSSATMFDAPFPGKVVTEAPTAELPDPDSDLSDEAEPSDCKITSLALLKRFAGDTSAHGVVHVISSFRGIVSRCLWALAVATTFSALVYVQVTLTGDLHLYPVKTVTRMEVKRALPFPGITLCNINDVDTHKVPFNGSLFRAFTSPVKVHESYRNPEAQSMLNTPISAVVNCSWIDFGDFLIKCSVNEEKLRCRDIFTFTQTSRARCAVLNTSHPSLRSMSFAGPMSGLRLYLNVHQEGYTFGSSNTAGVRMYIHEPGHLADIHNSGLLLSPGMTSCVGVTPVHFSFLPAPYKAFGQDDCVDTTDEEHSRQLRLTDKYTYNACSLQCALDIVANACGCNGMENDLANSSLPVCTVQQFYTCYDKKLPHVYYNVSADNKCGCDRSCDFVAYSPQISKAYFPSATAEDTLKLIGILPRFAQTRANYLEVRVYLNEIMVETRKHEAVYTLLKVVGSIGGHMGIFLGASILTVVEVAELGACFLIRFLKRVSGHVKLACAPDSTAVQSKPPTT